MSKRTAEALKVEVFVLDGGETGEGVEDSEERSWGRRRGGSGGTDEEAR
jgi:hypothetical protein